MYRLLLTAFWWSLIAAAAGQIVAAEPMRNEPAPVYPVALLTFEERGQDVQEFGAKVTDLLFAHLAANSALYLVDRQDIERQLAEQQLTLSGLVRPDQAIQVGQITGAKLLVTGSVLQVDTTIYLVGKVISTETSRVVAASVKGTVRDSLSDLASQLAGQIAGTIQDRADELVAVPITQDDRLSRLRRKLAKAKRQVVRIDIEERHIGQAVIDPSAETELILYCRETGFEVTQERGHANVLIQGEAFSEFATRHGNLISVKARLEVKAVDRATGDVIAVDRQTSIGVDLSEQIAGKTALQQSADAIAERLLPKLVQHER
ncbi:MAG: CsgG/HfaB family protein [Pirellulaceae bacterium]